MTTAAAPTTLDLADYEYAKPCMAKRCNQQATWLGLASHGGKECPGEAYVCDQHKEYAVEWWAEALKQLQAQGARCSNCKQPVLGQVSDHLKFIRL